jgi:hypothetical protein
MFDSRLFLIFSVPCINGFGEHIVYFPSVAFAAFFFSFISLFFHIEEQEEHRWFLNVKG